MTSVQKRYLFVCGCPRSGTTALWRLMVAHPDIVLGIERYVHFAFGKSKIKPDLFEKPKFYRIQPGETYYDDLSRYNTYYADAEQRFDQAAWVGDKIPPLDLDYAGIEANFENAHILYIVRNIIDVSGSYQRRAGDDSDVTWSADRDYRKAVSDWHHSIRATLHLLDFVERRTSIQVILYDDLFLQRADLRPIFDWLDLEVPQLVEEQYRNLLVRSGQLESQRGDGLNSMQRQYISTTAPFGLYRKLLEKRLLLSASQS